MCPQETIENRQERVPAATQQQQGLQAGRSVVPEELGHSSPFGRRTALSSSLLGVPAASLSLLPCPWAESTFQLRFLGSENKHGMKYGELLLALVFLRQRDKPGFSTYPDLSNPACRHESPLTMWKVGREM